MEHPVSLRTRDALLEEVLGYLDSGADALEEYLPPAEASELQERDQVKAVCGEDLTLAMNTMVLYTMAPRCLGMDPWHRRPSECAGRI